MKFECTADILRAQMNDTMYLQARVDDSQRKLGSNARVGDLLNGVRHELENILAVVESRALRCGVENDIPCPPRQAELDAVDGEGLELLVVLFCKYARYTSERRTSARQLGDQETANVLHQISSSIDDAIQFLDVYANAIAIRSQGSQLPCFDRRPAVNGYYSRSLLI
jgi:hypothetical protein